LLYKIEKSGSKLDRLSTNMERDLLKIVGEMLDDN
jgi:hypothetical protein